MIYIFIFSIAIFFAYIAYRNSNTMTNVVLLFCSMLPLIILAGCRDETIGTDVIAYPVQGLLYTSGTTSLSNLSLIAGLEPGYLLLAWIANLYDGQLSTLLTLTQIVITTCFYIGFYRVRKYVPLWLSVMLYCFLFYNMGLNMMRQQLAMSVVFLGFTTMLPDLGLRGRHKLTLRDVVKFAIFILVAFTFHKSALVAVLLIPVLYFRSTKINLICIAGVIVSFFLYSLLLSRLSVVQGFEKLEQYEVGGRYQSALSSSEFILRIVFLFTIYKSKRILSPIYRSILTVFVMEFVLNLFQLKSAFFGRVGYYFYMLYLPYMSYVIANTIQKSKYDLKSLSLTSLIVFYWWFVYISGQAGYTYPYSSKILDL